MTHLTCDTFFGQKIHVKQSRNGYRFSIDAVLLASCVRVRKDDRLVDLGTGCGIIPMMLAYRHPTVKIWGIEIQRELAQTAEANVRDNVMTDRIGIFHADMRQFDPSQIGGPVDIVVSNPPYRKNASGRVNPDHQKAVARHEIKVTLDGVLRTARRLLKTSGKFVTVYPAERAADLIQGMRQCNLEPKRTRWVHSDCASPAKLILAEAVAGGHPGMSVAPPLYIYEPDGGYTEEVAAMFAS